MVGTITVCGISRLLTVVTEQLQYTDKERPNLTPDQAPLRPQGNQKRPDRQKNLPLEILSSIIRSLMKSQGSTWIPENTAESSFLFEKI